MTKVKGSNSKSRGNKGYSQVEPLITPKELRERYLYGVTALDGDGKEMPDSTLQVYINNAVSMLEHDLDIFIMPRDIEEQKDYQANDYFEWGYLQLNHYPLICLESMCIAYLRSVNTTTNELQDEAVLDIPPEWIRLDADTGIVRLVPNNKFPSRLQVGAGGSFFPELFRRHGHVPDLWVINYTAGFKDGCIPILINQAIGYIAAVQYLNIAGDLIVGAGIAGSSISLDSMSQSIQTTSSAENHGYSAKLKEYQNLLFGRTKDDQTAIMKILRAYYKGSTINIV